MYTVMESASGNGRNRAAAVVDERGTVVACYHIRDVGRGYLRMAQADAAARNAQAVRP